MKVSILRYFAYGAALLLAFAVGHSFGNAPLLQKVGAYFADALSDPKTSAAAASAVFALMSLAVQYLVGNKQAIIGTRQAEASRISADAASLTAKNAGDRAIATMRIDRELHDIGISRGEIDYVASNRGIDPRGI